MPGCATEARTGGLAGAGIGALAGQAIGHDTESTLIGAAIGGAAGYIIGNERDKMKQQPQAQN
jgi:outer membrane lipoprotein SlyB